MAATGTLYSVKPLRIQVEEVSFAPQQDLCVHLKKTLKDPKAAQADSGIPLVFFTCRVHGRGVIHPAQTVSYLPLLRT